MYSSGGITFIIMTPFVMAHKKYNLDIKFDKFHEIENHAVIYSKSQLSSLTIKQHEHKLDYLNNLNDRVETLKDCI